MRQSELSSASECLPNTKVNIKRAGLLCAHKLVSGGTGGNLHNPGIDRGIQVVSKIKTHRAYRGFIAHAQAYGMGDVVVVASPGVGADLKRGIWGLGAELLVLM